MNSQDGDMCIHYVCMDRYTDTDTEVFKEEVDWLLLKQNLSSVQVLKKFMLIM